MYRDGTEKCSCIAMERGWRGEGSMCADRKVKPLCMELEKGMVMFEDREGKCV